MIKKLPEDQKWKLICQTSSGWFNKILTKDELLEWTTIISTYGGVFKDLPNGDQELVNVHEFKAFPLRS